MDERAFIHVAVWGFGAALIGALIASKIGAGFLASTGSVVSPLILGAIAGFVVYWCEYELPIIGAGLFLSAFGAWVGWQKAGVLDVIAFGSSANNGPIVFPVPWYDTTWFAWLVGVFLLASAGFCVFLYARDR